MSAPPVDLQQLAVHRAAPETRRKTPWLSRYALPGLILAGFLALVAYAARDLLRPARPVTVTPVLTTRAAVQQGGAPLFVAAGWVEPRPTETLVTALAEGVVEKLLVVQGQEVKAGEPVAQLVAIDAQLALRTAEADLHQREAEAESIVARTEAELVFLPFQLQSAEAQERVLALDLEGKKSAGAGVVSAIAVARVESEWIGARAKVGDLRVRKQRLERESGTLKQLQRGETITQTPLTDSEAAMKTALTRVALARLAVDSARLRLERITVRAPAAGRVLALIARPGSRLMSQAPGHEANTVVSLYDPARLQVRADVRFEDLPGVQPGQPVRIESPAVPGGPLEGEVLFLTALADIQKNTLQVKAAIKNAPLVLRPDMLVQVTFLAVQRPSTEPAATETLRILVPRALVVAGDGGPRVWVVDQINGNARSQAVKLGRPASADLIEVAEGLNPADKLIVGGREGLTAGQRITIAGEDATLGVGAPSGSKPAKLQRHEGQH